MTHGVLVDRHAGNDNIAHGLLWLSEALAQFLQERNKRMASLVHKLRLLLRKSAFARRIFAERTATISVFRCDLNSAMSLCRQ